MPHGGERRYIGKPQVGQWHGNRFVYYRGRTGKTYRVARPGV
jgi:hypothetical protein